MTITKKQANGFTVLGLSLLIILTIIAYLGLFNPTYEFVPPIVVEKDAILAVQEYIPNGENQTIRKIIASHHSETNLLLKTTALSAQNPITVEVTMEFPDLPEDAWNLLDEEYFIMFPFAVNSEKSLMDNQYYTANFPIKKNNDDRKYFGSGMIKYTFEGDKPFFVLLTANEINRFRSGDIAKLPQSYIQQSLEKGVFLQIEPSSTTTTLHTNNIVLALTCIVIAFGILQIRLSWKEQSVNNSKPKHC
ncbi:hypothetical protein [Candidatus Nitrosotenuis cloacae]|uniref:Uncharacterized protein n=1 Tax=Candidatus Nitrosotenuis cloacae TaxID=1603555 RepID=A0A3G1B5A5_9ARCH|nr:hypothetical protein [Candidatus Nitrosotenuis cloacae]AJZ75173.2 hypothetical protein SU86_000860 [Candidatus Nitrosotenuis cloacae]